MQGIHEGLECGGEGLEFGLEIGKHDKEFGMVLAENLLDIFVGKIGDIFVNFFFHDTKLDSNLIRANTPRLSFASFSSSDIDSSSSETAKSSSFKASN